MTFLHERAFQDGSQKISPSIPPLDDRSATGYGLGLDYSIPAGVSGWRVGVATELVMWSCPYVSYTTETYTGDMSIDEGTSVVPIAALAVTPSYRSGAWTGFANFTMHNHPTMIEKESSDLIAPDPEVKGGPLNVTAAAGVAFRQENVELALEVHQSVTDDPVQYGPAVGLMLRIGAGKRTHPQPATVAGPVQAAPTN
jgi:hypothetical protein